jgi:hypothetical protein
MNRTPARFMVLAATILAAPLALAETSPPNPAAPASAGDAAFAAQKAAFLALSLSTRKAAQDALVWLGLYNGVSDGEFGKRTGDAIVAWQARQKAAGAGALSPAELQALLAAAEKARAAVGFQPIEDPKTGARIGAPTKLLSGSAGAKLDFASDASGDLAALYARLSADGPARKVAYKAIKPDAFFVVSGQEGARKFFSRFERSAGASPPIRGFTFSYPAAKAADLDKVAIAVANAFEAFPPSAPAQGPAATVPAPPSSVAPPAPRPAATALIVAPGRALTALKAGDCPNPSVGGKPARFERADAATGLAILTGDFGDGSEPPRLGALRGDLVALSVAGDRLAASSASLAGDATRPVVVVAALEKSASGGPLFDREGALAGLVAPIAHEPKRVAGVALAAPHGVIEPQAIGAFLGGGELVPVSARTQMTAGAIAAREEHAVVGVMCGR